MNAASASFADSVPSSRRRWPGWLLSGIPTLFLLWDATIKLLNLQAVVEAFQRLGFTHSPGLAIGIGLLELVCLAVYAVPRTAPIGGVLLTGYLGGAVALHVRAGDPLGSHVLFPVYVGALLWAGLFLRDRRVRNVLDAGP
jgi:hypothetical protein